MLLQIVAALLFIASSGLLFVRRFRGNRKLRVCAGLLALASTLLMIEQGVAEIYAPPWQSRAPAPQPIQVAAPNDRIRIRTGNPLEGVLGGSSAHGSAWLGLDEPITLQKNVCLELGVTGSRIVLIRILIRGQDPDDKIGIVGGPVDVAGADRLLVQLDRRFEDVQAISVHGGQNAWDVYLGNDNPPASLHGVVIVPC